MAGFVGWSFKASLLFAKCNSKVGSPVFFPNKEALNGFPALSPFSFNGKYNKSCQCLQKFNLQFSGGKVE